MSDPATKPPETQLAQAGHECTDANATAIALSGLALAAAVAVLLAVIVLVIGWLRLDVERHAPALSPLAAPERPAPPLLQADPASDLHQLQQRQQSLLEEYAWLDREHNQLRIPIQRAMQLVVQRGLTPVKPMPPGQPGQPPADQPPATSSEGSLPSEHSGDGALRSRNAMWK